MSCFDLVSSVGGLGGEYFEILSCFGSGVGGNILVQF